MKTYLILGSNLGDSKALVAEAVRAIEDLPHTKLLRSSTLKMTKPYGYTEQPDFVNQVILVDTDLAPTRLLAELQKIELDMGRVREQKWGPRTIDIDILLMEDQILDTPELRVPHEDFHNRAFALELLCEIDEDLVHPVLGKTMKELLQAIRKDDKTLE